jgi:two-component system, cell cycle sensor histidine kinase and response regulator CckA
VLSTDKLTTLVNSLGGIVWEADGLTFRFTFVSDQAESLLGYPVARWLAEPDFWRRHTHPDDVQRCTSFCLDATMHGRDHEFEYRMIAADGRVVWLRDIVTVKGTADGPLLVGIMLDITRHKQDEEQLRRIHSTYRALVEHSSDYTSLLAADGTTVFQSGSIESHLGYHKEELVGRKNFQLLHPDDVEPARQMFAAIFASDSEVGPRRFRVRHKDGSWRILESIGRRFVEESGQTFAIINNRDVTEAVAAEEQLRQLHGQLAHAQKMEAIGRLAGGVAHDFNNLLTVIIGYSESLGSMISADDHRAKEVEEIRRAAERASVLTSQLLAFSRKQVLHVSSLDVRVVVRELSGMVRRLIGDDITLQLDLTSDTTTVVADRSQLELVLMNLAINARDAMPFGGTLTIRTALSDISPGAANTMELDAGRYVVIAMTDTGCGIEPAIQQRIFEPFFTTKEQGKGTGLGLSTVYGIVKQSGGNVVVESQPGRGAAFSIYLPAATEPANDERAPATSDAPRGTETILLVEDDRMVRDLVRQVLVRLGYRVIVAESGMAALARCRRDDTRIDLLITDVVMAGMSGPDLCARIESIVPGIGVLYISGYTGETVHRLGLAEEGVAFLQKPFTPQVLAEKTREVLDDSRRRRSKDIA